MGEAHWVVKNPDTTKYFFFDEGSWELAQLFDGTRTLTEIRDLYQSQFPNETIEMSFIFDWAESLRSMNMLVQSVVERNLQELSWIKDARRRKADVQAEGFNIFLIPFHVFDPDRFLTRTQKYVRWIWRPPTVLVALVFIAMTTASSSQHFGPIWAQTLELYAFLRKPFWDAVQFFVILSGIGLIHELAHGYACKFYGGDVHDIGVALFYFTPAFYCDTTDTLLFQNKWHRLWVVFAGMYIEAIVCCFATGLWVASYPDTLLHELAYKLMLFTGISTIFFNINPLRKIDGYYALASYLEIPELREDSFEYLSALFKRHVLRLNVEVPMLSRRKRRIFLIYAPLAIVFVILLMLFIGGLFYNFYAKYFPNLAGVLLALTLLRLFRTQVRIFLQGARLVYLDKKELIMSRRARIPIAGGAAALFARSRDSVGAVDERDRGRPEAVDRSQPRSAGRRNDPRGARPRRRPGRKGPGRRADIEPRRDVRSRRSLRPERSDEQAVKPPARSRGRAGRLPCRAAGGGRGDGCGTRREPLREALRHESHLRPGADAPHPGSDRAVPPCRRPHRPDRRLHAIEG